MAVYLLLDAVAFVVIMLYADFMVLYGHGGGDRHRVQRPQLRLGRHGEQEGARHVPSGAPATGTSTSIAGSGIAQFLSPFFLSALAGAGGTDAGEPVLPVLPLQSPFWPWAASSWPVMAIVKKNKVDYEREEPAFEGVEEDALASAEA